MKNGDNLIYEEENYYPFLRLSEKYSTPVRYICLGIVLDPLNLYIAPHKKIQFIMFLGIAFIEWIGYLAMVFVAASFLMKKLNTLRAVNSVGASLFILYGFLLDISWPIVITNLFILGLNLYYLLIKKTVD